MFMTVHKVQQFQQTIFKAPDNGRVGRNKLCKIGQESEEMRVSIRK
jgi:hypothetical protein